MSEFGELDEEFDDFDDEEFDEEEDEFESFDCHRDSHGYCGKAGSEECEFDCPYNRMFGVK
ncbi:MAG: hypothetical protein NVS9B14_21530 [Candidatus Acidiferrum sp.]